jgi:hypothetical protein
MCKRADVVFDTTAPYQFMRGVKHYVDVKDITSWAKHYGISDEVADYLYTTHPKQAANRQASLDYANDVSEEMESELGREVNYELDRGLLHFMKPKLTTSDIELCEMFGYIESIDIVDGLLFVVIKVN